VTVVVAENAGSSDLAAADADVAVGVVDEPKDARFAHDHTKSPSHHAWES
jgi:hypothetical protein